MPVMKAVVLASLLWLSDVTAFAPIRPVGSPSSSSTVAGTTTTTTTTTTPNAYNIRTTKPLFMTPNMQGTAAATHDLYSILGVPRDADIGVIRQAFRAMARIYHPDCNPIGNTNDQFQKINRAYEVLRNPDLRRNYDLYGFEGLGTSAASDAEEMEHRSHSQPGAHRAQNFGRQRYEDFMRVDNHNSPHHPHVHQSGPKWTSQREQQQQQRRPNSRQYRPREPFGGGTHHVRIEDIGMGHTSDTFFGQPRNSVYNNGAYSSGASASNGRPRRGGNYVPVDDPSATSHSFFGDVDKNGKPRGARVKRTTQATADTKASPNSFFSNAGKDVKSTRANNKRQAHSHQWAARSDDFFARERNARSAPQSNPSNSFFDNSGGTSKDGLFEISEPDSQRSLFEHMQAVKEKPMASRYAASNEKQTQPGYSHRSRNPDVRAPPRATPNKAQNNYSARQTTPTQNRPPVSNNRRPENKSSPFVGDGPKRAAHATNNYRSSIFQPSTGGPPKGRVSIGGDIQVELNIASTTALYGGLEQAIVKRLEPCDACGGNGATTTSSACSKCGSQGVKRQKKEVKVIVPAGSQDGTMIRLEGEGDAGANGGPPGDLYVFLRVAQPQAEACSPKAEAATPTQEETKQIEIPTTLNAEEQALLDKLRDLLDLKDQNNHKGLRP